GGGCVGGGGLGGATATFLPLAALAGFLPLAGFAATFLLLAGFAAAFLPLAGFVVGAMPFLALADFVLAAVAWSPLAAAAQDPGVPAKLNAATTPRMSGSLTNNWFMCSSSLVCCVSSVAYSSHFARCGRGHSALGFAIRKPGAVRAKRCERSRARNARFPALIRSRWRARSSR